MRSIVYSMLLCLITIFGCIDPIRLKTKDGAGALVVDGLITDEDGSYTINLSRTITFDNSRPLTVYANPETGATITISDNTGFSEVLTETLPGVYKTKDIRGVVGNTYTILIQTKDGARFYSQPETMLPVVKIDDVRSEFIVYDRFFINKNGQPQTVKAEGFNIYSVTTDPSGLGNYYRWQAEGIYEYASSVDDPTIRLCWVTVDRLESHLEVTDDALNDGQTFEHKVCLVPYDRPTRYMVKMKQSSLTKQAYQFMQQAESQQTSTGTIFDPPPTALAGNMKNDSGNPVLGYFGASSVKSFDFLFDRFKASGLATPAPNPPILLGDCRRQIPGATNVKPPGF